MEASANLSVKSNAEHEQQQQKQTLGRLQKKKQQNQGDDKDDDKQNDGNIRNSCNSNSSKSINSTESSNKSNSSRNSSGASNNIDSTASSKSTAINNNTTAINNGTASSNRSKTSNYVQQQVAQIDEKLLEITKRFKGEEEVKTSPIKSLTQEPTKDQTFVIQGGNGSGIIEQVLLRMGWKRVEKSAEHFKLKWVEIRSAVNFDNFREGEQMVNRIPNCHLLTNKLGMLITLQRFDRIRSLLNLTSLIQLKTEDFLPETYRLCDPSDRQLFMHRFKPGDLWISKPTAMNQGRGIRLVRDISEFIDEECGGDVSDIQKKKLTTDRIIQRYIVNPLLLENRKFDIRAYMLVACTKPYMVYYHKGYARLCLQQYSIESEDLLTHLTNQFIQKKDAAYEFFKEDTVWSMDKLNSYINRKVAPQKNIEADWVYKVLKNKLKLIMLYCFHAVKSKLEAKVGYFDLYGFDFMVDSNMKVWLIEINSNPCMATNCTALREIVPGLLHETLHLSIECFEKARRNVPVAPVKSQRNFETIYEGKTFGSPTTFDGNSPTDPLRPSAHLRSLQLSDRGKQFAVAASEALDQDKSDLSPTSIFEVRLDKTGEKSRDSREEGKFTILSVQEPVGSSNNFYLPSTGSTQCNSIETNSKEKNSSSSSPQKELSSESSTKKSVKLSRVVFGVHNPISPKEEASDLHVRKGKSKSAKSLSTESDVKGTKSSGGSSRIIKGFTLRSRQSSPTLRNSPQPNKEVSPVPSTSKTLNINSQSFPEGSSAIKTETSKPAEGKRDWSRKVSSEVSQKLDKIKTNSSTVSTSSKSEANKSFQSLANSTLESAAGSVKPISELESGDPVKNLSLSPVMVPLGKRLTQMNTNARNSSIDNSATLSTGTLSTIDVSHPVSREKVVKEKSEQNSLLNSLKCSPKWATKAHEATAKDLLMKDIVAPENQLIQDTEQSNVGIKSADKQETASKQRDKIPKPEKSVKLIRSRISLSSTSIAEQSLSKVLAADFKSNVKMSTAKQLSHKANRGQQTTLSVVNSDVSPKRRMSYDRIYDSSVTSHPYVQFKRGLINHRAKLCENVDTYRYQSVSHDPVLRVGASKESSTMDGGMSFGSLPLNDPARRIGTIDNHANPRQPLIYPWSPLSILETKTNELVRPRSPRGHTYGMNYPERSRLQRMYIEPSGSKFSTDDFYRYKRPQINPVLHDSHFNNSNSSSSCRVITERRPKVWDSKLRWAGGLYAACLNRKLAGPYISPRLSHHIIVNHDIPPLYN